MKLKASKGRQLTILVAATNAVGHVNAVTGATLPFLARGHRLVFVLEAAFAGTRTPLGYIEHIYESPVTELLTKTNLATGNPGEWMATQLRAMKVLGDYSPAEKTTHVVDFLYSPANVAEFSRFNSALEEALALYKPDLLYYDSGALMPALAKSGLPLVKNVSVNPIFFVMDDQLPPGGSGLPFNDRTSWPAFQQLRAEIIASERFTQKFVLDLGYPSSLFPDNLLFPHLESQLLTVYSCPQEINYPAIKDRKDWFNLEVFNKPPQKQPTLEDLLPETFLKENLEGRFSGKIMYLSLGSMGSMDVELLKRLIDLLTPSPHKYILSLGPRASEISQPLPVNMTGAQYLPQTELLLLVDLVITHGGNNTVCEAFAAGKPMLVLPLFADQLDNAQRLEETGYGLKLNPYHCTGEELNQAITQLLEDTQLKSKMKAASARIGSSKKHQELADLIEKLVNDWWSLKSSKKEVKSSSFRQSLLHPWKARSRLFRG